MEKLVRAKLRNDIEEDKELEPDWDTLAFNFQFERIEQLLEGCGPYCFQVLSHDPTRCF